MKAPQFIAEVIAEAQAAEANGQLLNEVTPKLSRSQRAADTVTEFCGSWTFIVAFAVMTMIWVGLNTVQIAFQPFDRYPFILLNLVFTVIELFQGPLIMMSQNRQMERDRDTVRGLHTKLDAILEIERAKQ
jgi:uncharacterized membrane protein